MSFNKPFYITTAINYANGSPHIGHAYEIIVADIIAKYYRISGKNVYFLTGTDEHGQKIAEKAKSQGLSPKEMCDKYSDEFKNLNNRLNITNDHFIKTTDDYHINKVSEILNVCFENDDIYLGTYSGWYNIREETFVSESEAQLNDYKDPLSNVPLQKMEESSYFFRLSKYKQQLIDHINNNPEFIQPSYYQKNILGRLNDDLHDLSISRTSFDWGIKMTNDPNHVLYVWFDALINYISGTQNNDCWPPNVQIIGKDIIWFHSVIWPCILMSLKFELPTTIFCHGFIHDENGNKMSKSLNNVIDPNEILNEFPSDSFRLSLIAQNAFGNDISFSKDRLITIHNADIADTIGNLVNRSCSMIKLYCNNLVPNVESNLIFNISELIQNIETHFQSYNIHLAYDLIINTFRDINIYLTNQAPWKIKNDDNKRNIIIKNVIDSIYAISHFLYPFIPNVTENIFKSLSTKSIFIKDLTNSQYVLPNTEILKFEFIKLGNTKDKPINIDKNININVNKNKNPNIFETFDIRIGFVNKVYEHPNSNKLYYEEVDIGESKCRTIVSGLRNIIDIDQFEKRKVVVVCNLKPIKLAGISSEGMILCVNLNDNIELLQVEGNIGDRLYLEGSNIPDIDSSLKNKKSWDKVQSKLKTNEDGIFTFDNIKITTSTKYCYSNIKNGNVS